MMRNLTWSAVWATLLSASLAQAQGPGYYSPYPAPYGNPANFGQAVSPFRPPMGAPCAPGNMPYGYCLPGTPACQPGTVGGPNWAWGDRAFKPYDNFILPAQAVAPPGGPTQTPSNNAAGKGQESGVGSQATNDRSSWTPDTRTPAPGVGTVDFGEPCADNLPSMTIRNPLDPLPEPSSRRAEREILEKYRIDRGEAPWSLLPPPDGNAAYRSWLLNTLWKLNFDAPPEVPYRTWISGEYLRMSIKSAPLAVPLVTANPDSTTIAALSDPGTVILFGAGSDQSTKFSAPSGWRLTAGWWLDTRAPLAMEINGFLLEKRVITFDAASAGNTDTVVSIPFNATQPFNFINPAGETSLNAGGAANNVNVTMTSRLWGMEANLIADPHPDSIVPLRVMPTLGFRYLDLLENLTLTDTFVDTVGGGTVVVSDGFGTRNQFFGGQVGLRTYLSLGRWFLDSNARIALGVNRETLNIAGASVVNNGAFGLTTGTTLGGVFAQPSNIGGVHRGIFAYAPEGQLKAGYQLSQTFRLFAAYQILYLNSVIRPGNQIDRNVNPTQNAFFSFPPTPVGPQVPLPLFRASDFWAHGISFGIECRF